jgi:hypothetical protein
MAAQYPLLLGGVYGSTARGEDTEWSDLEMWFVLVGSAPVQEKHWIVCETAVGCRICGEQELIEQLTHPDAAWPFVVGVLDVLKVLYGDPAKVQAWLTLARETPRARFHAYLAAHLPEFVVESYGRIHSSAERGDWATARYSLTEVLFEMQRVLCLLNQRWVTRDYDAGLLQVAAFPKIPTGYGELVPALLAAQDFETLLPLAERLVNEFWLLIAEEGVEVVRVQSAEEIDDRIQVHK